MMKKECCKVVVLVIGFQSIWAGASAAIPEVPTQGQQQLSPALTASVKTILQALEDGSSINISSILVNATQGLGLQSAWKATDSSWAGVNEKWRSLPVMLSSVFSQSIKAGFEFSIDHHDAALLFAKGQENLTDASKAEKEISSFDQSNTVGEPVPGVTAAVYQDFFTKASAVAVKLLEENFKKVKLDSVTAVAQVPVIGPFAIKLEDVQLEGLRLDKGSTGVSLGTDGTFDLVISGLDAIVDGHFQWRRTRFPFISGGCQAQVAAVNGNVRLKVTVVGDESGRPKIADLEAAQLSFDSLSITTSGAKLSWLYNAVAAFAHTQIQEAITRAVSKQVSTTVPGQINHLLDGVPTIVHVKDLDLNTSLAKDPEVTPERLLVWDWGRFQNPDHKLQECPFVRAAAIQGTDKPILPGGAPYQIIADIDESIVNCLTWDMYKKGKLQALVQGDDLPEKALYTDTWRLIIPAVYKTCPGCPMAVKATVTSAPSTLIHKASGIVTRGTAELSFFLAETTGGSVPWTLGGSRRHFSSGHINTTIIQDEEFTGNEEQVISDLKTDRHDGLQKKGRGARFEDLDQEAKTRGFQIGEHLFTLSLSGELLVHQLSLDKDSANGWVLNLAMKINQPALEVQVLQSDVGKINEAALHFGLTVAAFLVEDKVNHGILANGFPLPNIPHVNVERANVTVVEHALALGADFSYREN